MQHTMIPNITPCALDSVTNPGSARLGNRPSTCRRSILSTQTQIFGKSTQLGHLRASATSGNLLQTPQEGKEDRLMPRGEAVSV